MDRQFKRAKKGAVSLTSLLDLLFVMIFVSLLQQKAPSKSETQAKTPAKPVETKPVIKPIEKPVEKPKPIIKKVHALTATFDFKGAGYNGIYSMEGIYNIDSRNMNLASIKWINKSDPRLEMVPLSGRVSEDKMSIKGRVEFEGCKTFTLNKIKDIQGSNPISGVWKGRYTCSQGSTGLTLTIK